jgi:anti-sigma B factor antagonist
MAQFEARTSAESGRVVVSLAGECDLSVRDELTTALLAAVGTSRMVVVDLGALSFLDSSGLHGLVTAYHAAQRDRGHLYVVNAGGVVADLLDLTGVADLLSPPADGTRPAGDHHHA